MLILLISSQLFFGNILMSIPESTGSVTDIASSTRDSPLLFGYSSSFEEDTNWVTFWVVALSTGFWCTHLSYLYAHSIPVPESVQTLRVKLDYLYHLKISSIIRNFLRNSIFLPSFVVLKDPTRHVAITMPTIGNVFYGLISLPMTKKSKTLIAPTFRFRINRTWSDRKHLPAWIYSLQ